MANLIDLFSSKVDKDKLIGENNFFNNEKEIKEFNKLQKKFISNIDYTSPKNFARFGSAEEYYKCAIQYIDTNYAYDLSKADRLGWENSLNELEYFIYKNEYPKSTGYATFSGSQFLEVYSHTQNPEIDSKTIYENGSKYTSNTQLDFDKGITFEAWFKFYGDTSTSSSILTVTAFEVVNNSTNEIELFSIIRDTDTKIKIINGSNSWSFSQAIEDNLWNHYSFNIKQDTVSLCVNGNIKETISVSIDALTYSFTFIPIGLMLVPITQQNILEEFNNRSIFKIGGGAKFSIDEARLWNETRTTEEIGRYWFTNVNGNDFLSNTNSSLIFYFKFNEGWDPQYKFLCLDYSGRKNDSEIVNYVESCRSNGSAIDESGICDDKEKPDIIYRGLDYSSTVKQYFQDKIVLGKEHDEQNIYLLYNKFPSWVIEGEESNEIKHLKQLIQIVSVYFDDLYNKIHELTELKQIKYGNSTDNIYPFYDKILTSMGFDVTDLFSNMDPIEKYSSRSEITLFDEDIDKTKNKILQNIYNNLNYILKSKGTERSLKALLKSYGVNDDLVRLNLYSDGANYNISDRMKEKVVKKKIITLNNNSSIYLKDKTISNNQELYNYTLETSLMFNVKKYDSSLTTGSIMGLYTYLDDDINSSVLEKNYITLDKNMYGEHRFTLHHSGNSVTKQSTAFIDNIYDDSVWNVCLRKKPNVDNLNSADTSSLNYNIELYAINKNRHFVQELSCSLPIENEFGSLRYYIGADKENITGSIINKTNFDVLYCNFWNSYLNNSVVMSHNMDIFNNGVDE